MSNSPLENSGKTGVISSPTIGFRFHSSNEELEELQSKQDDHVPKLRKADSELKINTELLASDYLDPSKSEQDRSEAIGDAVKDIWNLLGRKSASVDSTYESPFSNPIETWRKLNELKGKITKTVEEKISEMKIDRNVLGKTSRSKLSSSKENSSISDSEDTSESSKQSELWKDAEDANSSSEKTSDKNLDLSLSSSVESAIENIKTENEIQGSESELRNRKSFGKVSDILNVSDIKIATAKIENEGNLEEENFVEDVESGVEAEETFDTNLSESFHLLNNSELSTSGEGSSTPPGGNNIHSRIVSSLSAMFSKSYTIALMIGFGVFFFIPLSDFLKGFLLCFLLLVLSLIIKSYLRIDNGCTCHTQPVHVPDSKSSPLIVPKYVPVKGVWINEYEREIYDPDYYSVTQTVPAYLELDNSTLKLSRPKGKIHKRATFDEPEYKMQFTSQRIYNISGCNVFLMPEGLTRKRLFSKKYPIVIYLRPDSLIAEKKKGKETDEKESGNKNANKTINTIDKTQLEELTLRNPDIIRSKNTLYLFARCDRQKEEWYRRLLAATRLCLSPDSNELDKEEEKAKVKGEEKEKEKEKEKGNTDGSSASTPFESLFFDDDEAQYEEYLRYMSKYVGDGLVQHEIKAIKPPRSANKKMKTKKKDVPANADGIENVETVVVNSLLENEKTSHYSEVVKEEDKVVGNDNYSYQVQWFNAFINRILFDMFRSPYWLDRIHDKVQKKLNSIRLPYYIEDIEVIEMDLGKTGPTFHRVSQPYLDERGLWFDMDTNFDGLIKMTIQTHLNLVKLQKGVEENSAVTQKPDKGKKMQKEVRDTLLVKESNEKSTDCVESKNKKLGKKLPNANSKDDETKMEESNPKSADNNQIFEFKSLNEGNVENEIEELAKIAVEEGLAGSSKEGERQETGTPRKEPIRIRTLRSPIYDSELEDSAESSDEEDEECEELPPVCSSPEKEEQTSHGPVSTARRYPRNRRSSKRIFRVFENVAQSKYFKTVAQSKYIQKAIAGVSATKLKLSLEIKGCTGILTINIPPPPSDRFWYGFRYMPDITLSANPKIGDKAVGFTHIKNYLQKKILREIKKTLVVPNMIDFVLPTSSPGRSSSSLHIEQPDLDEQEPTTPSE